MAMMLFVELHGELSACSVLTIRTVNKVDVAMTLCVFSQDFRTFG